MANPPRMLAFILAATDQGSLIVNRFDYRIPESGMGYGVGFMLLRNGSYDPTDVAKVQALLKLRRQYFGDGVVALDCGANIGVFTTEWAKCMTGWGSVLAIEAQERLYYALAGNIALNNCFNARAVNVAVGATMGTIRIPRVNYCAPGTFGSLELRQSENNEFIGQSLSYAEEDMVPVQMLTIDSLGLTRLDFLKIDVEGMELEVLAGAAETIRRTLPILMIERLKTRQGGLLEALTPYGYTVYEHGLDILAIHPSDKTITRIAVQQPAA
jgi:FkbM family methyltransferase